VLTGQEFFPTLISKPFHSGLVIVFSAAAVLAVLGAIASLLRGKMPTVIAGPEHDEVAQLVSSSLVLDADEMI
jgi:hypothetical protein